MTTQTIAQQLQVCAVAVCGALFNPARSGDPEGRCGGCALRARKAAVRISYDAKGAAQAAKPVAPAPKRENKVAKRQWASEDNGVCNRCAGTGIFGSFGDCFRCGGTGVAPGHKDKSLIADAASAADLFEEVTLDLGYERPAFLAEAADRQVPMCFGDYTKLQAEIVMRRSAYLVSRKGITQATGWQVATPVFARNAVTSFSVIPF